MNYRNKTWIWPIWNWYFYLNFCHFLKTRSWCNGCLNGVVHLAFAWAYRLQIATEWRKWHRQCWRISFTVFYSFYRLPWLRTLIDSLWGSAGFKELARGSKPCHTSFMVHNVPHYDYAIWGILWLSLRGTLWTMNDVTYPGFGLLIPPQVGDEISNQIF